MVGPGASIGVSELKNPAELEWDARTVSPGVKTKLVQQTFRLYEEEVHLADKLTGFRRVCTILCVHLPAVQDGDVLLLEAPRQRLVGKAEVLEHTHKKMRKGDTKTALAIKLLEDVPEQEESNG